MKWPKNTLTLILMLSSIVLLFGLEAYWLRSVYNEGRENFQNKTSELWRTTVFSARDRVLQPYLDIPVDSVWTPAFRDSLRAFQATILETITLESLRKDYELVLEENEIHLPFTLVPVQWQTDQGAEPRRESERQERWRRGFGFGWHQPVFDDSDVSRVVLKEISPQILFSFFLNIITIGAFITMYRNVRLQQRLMELKNDFISNLTHELKTPIATASVALEALKNFKGLDDPKRTAEYLDMAQGELNRLTILTDKVLKTTIFDQQGIEFTWEQVDLEVVIEQILKSMKLVFEKTQTKVEFKTEGKDFSLEGAADHITNVIYNLIDNALKYRSQTSEITIRLVDKGESVMIAVQDNGIGIAPEYKKKIFEKFFRVPSGNVHNIRGYGLGLSYVHSVVKSHHGTINVDSELGKGSNFTIVLPRKQS